jgi:hypothetical protein
VITTAANTVIEDTCFNVFGMKKVKELRIQGILSEIIYE